MSTFPTKLPSKPFNARSASTYSCCVTAHRHMPCRFGVIAVHLRPHQQNLRPKGPPSSLPGSWSAVTMKEASRTKQSSSLLPGSKVLAPCFRFWRGAAVYDPLFLRYTDWCGSIGFVCWGREVKIYTLPPSPFFCHSHLTRLPFLYQHGPSQGCQGSSGSYECRRG